MPKVLHVPTRMCIACRGRFAKDELIRIVVSEGIATIDSTMRMQTRGLYICKNPDCIAKALKSKAFERMLKGANVEELKKHLMED